MTKKDLTGKRFGKLVTIKRDELDSYKWVCKCDCGNCNSIYMYNLTSGKSKSCGCECGFLASRKDTKCWDCNNISRCEWSRGEPVPNWVAVPTKIKQNADCAIDSFMVFECPKFEQKIFKEGKMQYYLRKAKELGVSERTVRRKLKKGEIEKD